MVRVMWVALVTHALSQFRSRRTVLLFKMQERAEMRDFSFFFFFFSSRQFSFNNSEETKIWTYEYLSYTIRCCNNNNNV